MKVRDVKIDEDNVLFYYFGGAQSKGFARLRNVSKSTFLGQDWARKVCRFSVFLAIDEVRAELVRDISRSLRFL